MRVAPERKTRAAREIIIGGGTDFRARPAKIAQAASCPLFPSHRDSLTVPDARMRNRKRERERKREATARKRDCYRYRSDKVERIAPRGACVPKKRAVCFRGNVKEREKEREGLIEGMEASVAS